MSFNFLNSSDSSLPYFFFCFDSKLGSLIFLIFVITYILLVPLFCLIIYSAVKKHTGSTNARTSHSDFFTYNVVGLELISMMGSCLYSFGSYSKDHSLQLAGVFVSSFATPGQVCFHLLTCVERYLAVVHPVIYLGLKKAGGLRIRNISTVCIWLLCCGFIGFSSLLSLVITQIMNICLLVFSLILVSFCSFSVLCVLHQPGPGQVIRDGERVAKAKHRAFYTIVAILLAQLFRFIGGLIISVMFNLYVLSPTSCAVGTSALWLTLPCSLVLPLLYLQRTGKLPGRKHKGKSGQGFE